MNDEEFRRATERLVEALQAGRCPYNGRRLGRHAAWGRLNPWRCGDCRAWECMGWPE